MRDHSKIEKLARKEEEQKTKPKPAAAEDDFF